MGWVINRIPYCSSDDCAGLGVGYGVGRLVVKTHNSQSKESRIQYLTYGMLQAVDVPLYMVVLLS